MPFAEYENFDACVAKNSSKKDPKAYCAAIMKAVEKPAKEMDALEATFSKDDATGKMTADVAIIKAGRAKNPRNYRATALQKAAKEGIYNGLRMFVDHSDKPPVKRGFKEMVSAVESTRWGPDLGPKGGIRGTVEFFDEKFFDQVQRAQKYIGISADHRIKVNYVQEGQQRIEDVLEIAYARSVDWVLYPSAGGEILQFVREGEGADSVEWNEVTLDELKANVPQLVAQIQAEVKPATEGEDDAPKAPVITPEMVAEMVAKGVQEAVDKMADTDKKRDETAKSIRELITKSGLPNRVQTRIIAMFSDALEFDEGSITATINDAKEELKELGVGPKVTGEGPTGAAAGGKKPQAKDAREGVEAVFGFKKD
jgi:hypothetical protein